MFTPLAHTSGPWQLDPPSMSHVTGGGYHSIIAGDGFSQGRYVGFTVSGWISDEDARLIAAAPDLLAALQRLMGGTTDFDDALAANAQAKSAIARATGA